MPMPVPLSNFLRHHHVDYNILKHKSGPGSLEVARTAGVPLEQLVLSTVLQRQQQPEKLLMVLTPANQQLDLSKLAAASGDHYQIVDRQTLTAIFQDCQPGIVPGLGQPFNLEMIADSRLFQQPQVYLEDGDNTELIKLNKEQFISLMQSIARLDVCSAPSPSCRSSINE